MEPFIIIVLLFIAGVMNGECDTIAFHDREDDWLQTVWWTRSNWKRDLYIQAWNIKSERILKFVNSEYGWRLIKTIGNFTLDGWHFCKFIQLNCFYAALTILAAHAYMLAWPTATLAWIAFSFIHAFGFQISFEDTIKL